MLLFVIWCDVRIHEKYQSVASLFGKKTTTMGKKKKKYFSAASTLALSPRLI